jgi:hypothetical protein
VLDYTGKEDLEGGRKVTQGASLMAMSAFAKAGAMLVERFDTSVSELELKYSNNRLIGADPGADMGPPLRNSARSWQVRSRAPTITSSAASPNSTPTSARSAQTPSSAISTRPIPRAAPASRLFVINVGVDLRLVDTKTLEVKT